MELRTRCEVVAIKHTELVLRDDEWPTAEAVVAAYYGGKVAESLIVLHDNEETIVRDDDARMVINGARRALLNDPPIDPLYRLTEAQRTKAVQMLIEIGAPISTSRYTDNFRLDA